MCEIRFRSYFRERATDFQVLDAITTFEESKYAYQSTLDLLHHTPDLFGVFIAGGGKSGVLRGLREDASGLAKTVNVVGLDLTPEARSGTCSTASSTSSSRTQSSRSPRLRWNCSPA